MAPSKTRIFDLQYSEDFVNRCLEGVQDILNTGFLTNHDYVRQFENDFQSFNHCSQAVAVSHGTSALEIAFRCLGVEGKKVVVPANTFIATPLAVLRAGGQPLLVDIESDYFGLAPEKLKECLKRHRETVAAVCQVHIGSHVSTHFTEILEIAESFRLPVVEDACQALGASLNGTRAGNFGDYGCYSFHMTKIMTTGEGGMLVSRNRDLAPARSLRQFGVLPEEPLLHSQMGGNHKMTEFAGLLGVLELARVQERVRRRRAIAKRYQDGLAGSGFRLVKDGGGSLGSHYKQIVLSPHVPRDLIAQRLKENQIDLTGGVYYHPLHKQPSMRPYLTGENFPAADEFAAAHFCPPCYPELEFAQVDGVCEILLELDREFR